MIDKRSSQDRRRSSHEDTVCIGKIIEDTPRRLSRQPRSSSEADDEQTELESEDNYGIEFDEEGMCADPTPEFWEAWQEDKEKIKEIGWWVVKERDPTRPLWGKWLIFETQEHLRSYNDRQKKQRAKLRIRRARFTTPYLTT